MGKRYKATEIYENRFYKIPKAFFLTEKYKNMHLESKVVYGFLDDRRELSLENNWIDEEGSIYLIFTRKDIQDMLCLSDKPVTRAFKELKEYGLIEEERQGINKPNLIYVCHIDFENIEEMRIRKISDTRIGEYTNQESENIRGNDTEFINTDYIETEKVVVEAYSNSINHKLTKSEKDKLIELCNSYPNDLILKAIDMTIEQANNVNIKYIRSILESFKDKGLNTLQEVETWLENDKRAVKKGIENKRNKLKNTSEPKSNSWYNHEADTDQYTEYIRQLEAKQKEEIYE